MKCGKDVTISKRYPKILVSTMNKMLIKGIMEINENI